MHQNNIFFYFLKIIFYISTSKLSENIKKNLAKNKFPNLREHGPKQGHNQILHEVPCKIIALMMFSIIIRNTWQITSIGVETFFSLILSYFCFFVPAFNPCHGRLKQRNWIKLIGKNYHSTSSRTYHPLSHTEIIKKESMNSSAWLLYNQPAP